VRTYKEEEWRPRACQFSFPTSSKRPVPKQEPAQTGRSSDELPRMGKRRKATKRTEFPPPSYRSQPHGEALLTGPTVRSTATFPWVRDEYQDWGTSCQ